MRSLVTIPAKSSHGGTLYSGYVYNTLAHRCGGYRVVSVYGDLHCCPRRHHGITRVFSTGFAIIGSRRTTRCYDICGCGARIMTRSDNTYSD